MNQAELARHLASDRYSEEDCRALLRKDEAGRAAEYLRATDRPRAVDLAIAVLESAKYETQCKVLGSDRGLLSIPRAALVPMLPDDLEASRRRALARPLLEWLELGKDEHLEVLDQELAGLRVRDLARSVQRAPECFARLWRLLEPKLGADFDARAVAILETGEAEFIALAAEHLASSLGIELESLGVAFTIGGVNHEDVALHGFKPMLELVFRHSPALFWNQIVGVFENRIRGWGVPWMLDFLGPNVTMVDAAPSRAIVLRSERLVVAVSGKFKGQGRLSCKLHKTIAAAQKDEEKRLAAAEAKLGQPRTAWDGVVAPSVYTTLHAEGPNAALRLAARGQLVDVEGLMNGGADPREDERCMLGSLQYGAVRRFLEAGVSSNLDAALLAQVSRNPSQRSWPSLNQKACILILRAGAGGDAIDRHGWTALHYAASYGWTKLIEALLEAGVDKETPAGLGAKVLGQRPVEVAQEQGRHLAAALLR